MVSALVSVRNHAGFPILLSSGSRQTPWNPAILPGFPPPPPPEWGSGGSRFELKRPRIAARRPQLNPAVPTPPPPEAT